MPFIECPAFNISTKKNQNPDFIKELSALKGIFFVNFILMMEVREIGVSNVITSGIFLNSMVNKSRVI